MVIGAVLCRRFPALVTKLRAFAENQRGGFKQGLPVAEPQAAGKKPLPVLAAERHKQPVKRANVCWVHKMAAGFPAGCARRAWLPLPRQPWLPR